VRVSACEAASCTSRALVTGLASQQLANDPGGDRYIRLIDDAVMMFAEHVPAGRGPKRDTKA
jgi:hypothetical protein